MKGIVRINPVSLRTIFFYKSMKMNVDSYSAEIDSRAIDKSGLVSSRTAMSGDSAPRNGKESGRSLNHAYRVPTRRSLDALQKLRMDFPQPFSDDYQDAYFVVSIMKALNDVDALKSNKPILGGDGSCQSRILANIPAEVSEEGKSVEQVIEMIVSSLEGMPLWAHPLCQAEIIPPTTIPSIIGTLLPAIFHANLLSSSHEECASGGIEHLEELVSAMVSRLVGYNPDDSGGVFTFGGTGPAFYAAKLGLEKAMPGSMEQGMTAAATVRKNSNNENTSCGEGVILSAATQPSHNDRRQSIAGWLGLGRRNAVSIATQDETNDIRIDLLEAKARELIERHHKRIVCIIATMGSATTNSTTDAFEIDDLHAIVRVRDQLVEDYQLNYVPHIHADASMGWAWSVFTDYNFERNELEFPPRTVRALAGVVHRLRYLYLADSMGIDFHTTGFAPSPSSLLLVKNRHDWSRLLSPGTTVAATAASDGLSRQHPPPSPHSPGRCTLESVRSAGSALGALANLQLFGKVGLRRMLGHLVEMAELLREHLESHDYTTVLNDRHTFGLVTVAFRVYPDGVDTWDQPRWERTDPAQRATLQQHNTYNRAIFDYLKSRSNNSRNNNNNNNNNVVQLAWTNCYRMTDYGEPVAALTSCILSPFVDESSIRTLLDNLADARAHVANNNVDVDVDVEVDGS